MPLRLAAPRDALTAPATYKALLLAEEDRNDASGRYERRTMTTRVLNLKWPDTGLGLLLGCLGFVAQLRCEAQNLVPNPGFEESDTCAFGLGFTGDLHDWISANGTPDQLQGCQPYGALNGLPLNFLTFQQAFEGNACVGLITYHENGQFDQQREWIQAPLLEPMVVGQTYYCSFRANAGFGGNAQYPQIWLANNKVGMLFTMDSRPAPFGYDPVDYRPNFAHVLHSAILNDTVAWNLVSGSFVPDSAYRYVMMGQFFSNALTDTLHFASPEAVDPWYPRAYTLLDAVCVSPDPNGCELAQGVDEHQDTAVTLYPNPATDQLVVVGADGAWGVVTDALGRVVWHGRLIGARHTVHVGQWARGSYTLLVEQGTKSVYKRFVLAE